MLLFPLIIIILHSWFFLCTIHFPLFFFSIFPPRLPFHQFAFLLPTFGIKLSHFASPWSSIFSLLTTIHPLTLISLSFLPSLMSSPQHLISSLPSIISVPPFSFVKHFHLPSHLPFSACLPPSFPSYPLLNKFTHITHFFLPPLHSLLSVILVVCPTHQPSIHLHT